MYYLNSKLTLYFNGTCSYCLTGPVCSFAHVSSRILSNNMQDVHCNIPKIANCSKSVRCKDKYMNLKYDSCLKNLYMSCTLPKKWDNQITFSNLKQKSTERDKTKLNFIYFLITKKKSKKCVQQYSNFVSYSNDIDEN